ncbi:hypothetical protein [Kitasatospora griseola]|uniref:hypothetical protein n=1 Tax=Kitasatospora griseola TaxID=2064 RepID=UPI00366494D1
MTDDTDTAAVNELRYATDITRADVTAVHDFLNARTNPQLVQAGGVRRTARALQNLASDAYARAAVQLQRLHDIDSGERHPSRSRLDELFDLRDAWNRLHLAAEPWNDHPDFNPRWQRVEVDTARAGTENSDGTSRSTA